MAQPLLAKLKQRHPDAIIDVIASSWVAPVIQRMPEVHSVMDSPLKHGKLNWTGIVHTAEQLKEAGYDEAIILPNSFKSALITFKAGIPVRRGFLGEMRYLLINKIVQPDPKKSIRLIDRYLMIADKKTLPQAANNTFCPPYLQSSTDDQRRVLSSFSLDQHKPIITLCPGAEYGPAKRWPAHHFAKLIDLLSSVDCQICLLGSQKDFVIAEEILTQASTKKLQCFNLCGKTSLNQAIDLLAASSVAVVHDSGLMHVACASNIPVVAIYGSSSPSYTPPVSPIASIVQNSQPCSPCFSRTCRFGHYNCLESVLPEQIFQNLQDMCLITPHIAKN